MSASSLYGHSAAPHGVANRGILRTTRTLRVNACFRAYTGAAFSPAASRGVQGYFAQMKTPNTLGAP